MNDLSEMQIEEYLALAKALGGAFVGLVKKLKHAGVDPAVLVSISQDYDGRIALAEAEASGT